MKKQDFSMMPTVMQDQQKPFSRGKCATLVCMAMLIGLTTATQLFAWRFQYQDALGFNLYHVYFPWMFLEWAATWYPKYLNWFIGCGSAGGVVTSILLIILTMRQIVTVNSGNGNEFLHGSARWAAKEDIEKAGLFSENGVYVGGWEDPKTGKQHYLRHNGSEHLLCIAPTRSGKGICLVIPTLLSWKQSCVITDLKGELWALTAGWRKEHARNKVLRFEPAAETGCIGWNPMEEIRLSTAYEIGDVQNLATMIVDPDGKGLKDHWQKTSQALLVGCILHLLYQKKNGDIEDASLPAVDRMLSDPAKPVSELWKDMIRYQHKDGANHPVVGQSAQDMIDRPEQEAGSVLSTAKSYLALFRDPVVAGNVNRSEFKIKDLMNHESPVSLYIITQPADKARLKPLVRILVNMICRILAEKMHFVDTEEVHYSTWEKVKRICRGKSIQPTGGGRRAKGEYKYKLLMMLDEFPSLGKLEIVQESLAFLAGYGIRFYIICQDTPQLRSEETGYGKDEAISSNCHIQNAFQPNRLETAQYLSKLTGQTTVVKEQITTSGKRLSPMLGSVSKTYQEVSRPLMTEDECLRMRPPEKDGEVLVKGGDMLVTVAGFPAIRGCQMPYFLDPVFQARSAVNPPEDTDRLREAVTPVMLMPETQSEETINNVEI